ncbi:uncharacterized protein C18orf25 homolog isoform X2 [Clupea harengus]|uniref:Uncharacterized protein C18orf25 homolog isoform X2 n=1 Tax=Clupea harengus TaxID=7950 RepID=A0A6P3WCT7_CLUHA|nr:uncharacterized protein C18orf25 homolog isoform X2 [Clupea harengus]
MANQEKDTETLPECSTEDTPVKSETTSSPLGEEASAAGDTLSESCSAGLLSMPCLLKDLRPQNTGGSTRPRAHDESDSSPCLLSPSSSGHLGDSDTQSSAEEGKRALGTGAVVAGDTAATGRKSRRSHSESDTPNATMAAKKNRCQERQANGRVRVRGHRSRLQKERMRMRRQKREAAARRKPDLLQDSSTSDSDITAQSSSSSSSSSSSDNEHGAGINSHTPVGPEVLGHYDVSDTHSEKELPSAPPHSLPPSGEAEAKPPKVSRPSSDSEVEIVGVQENPRFPRGGVIKSLSSWKTGAKPTWNTNPSQSGWAPPSEVVDLTLEEDRQRYLL